MLTVLIACSACMFVGSIVHGQMTVSGKLNEVVQVKLHIWDTGFARMKGARLRHESWIPALNSVSLECRMNPESASHAHNG